MLRKSKYLIIFLVGLLSGLLLSLLVNKHNVELKDGDYVVASIKNHEITSNDIYDSLKSSSGLTATLDKIDNLILNEMYKLSKDDEKKINENIKEMYELYENSYGYSKKEFLTENNFSSEDAFKKYMTEDYLKELYYHDYLKEKITEKDIDKYYDKYVFGEKKVYLYSSGTKSDLDKINKYLKNKKDYDYISKHAGDVVCEDLGYVDFRSNIDKELLTTIKNTKKGKYSGIVEIETYGYVIVYVDDSKKTESKEDMKDDIIEAIIKEKDQENSNGYYQAFVDLRRKNEIKFYDDELSKYYKDFIKSLK